MIDWIGRTLGRVQIKSLLARGGMAEVYLGTHTTLHREVAVKILRYSYADDPRLLERFELEARAVAQLRHPNIVQVFDFDTIEDQPYLVMEYISGPSLSKYLAALHAKNGRLELPLIARLLEGVAGALQYAHESGVIHRDVKPGNILLTSRSIRIVPGETMPVDFQPVLTDFGLVRFLNSSRQTTLGQTAGTPAYMSPEQALGLATDGRTDIYSLGIVLYEMLSGSVPFDGETTMSVLLKHLNEAPAPIPGLAPVLQQVLDHALAKNADDRFHDPEDFAAAFDAALRLSADARTAESIAHVLEPGKADKPAPPERRRLLMPAILAGSLIILASVAILLNGMLPAARQSTPTVLAFTDTPVLSIPVTLGPTGVLQFRDGDAFLDQAILTAQAMPVPPAGSQYRVWLVSGGGRQSLGILRIAENGKGELTFEDPQDRNLLGVYRGVEITTEPIFGSDPDGSASLTFGYALPDDGLLYLRRLLVSFPGTPREVGLIHGLTRNARLLDEATRQLRDDYENGDEAGVRADAERIMNLLVGNESPDHRDWDGDGRITDPGDGYGFMHNLDNLGYIQAVFSHADYAVNSAGVSRNIIVNGEDVKTCAQNLARWAPELSDQVSEILNATDLAGMGASAGRAAELAGQILHGFDFNENGEIDPATGECGVVALAEHAYRMADMPLLPVNPLDTPIAMDGTVTASPTYTPSQLIAATPTSRKNSSPTTVAPATSQPPANNPNQPTKKPRPTQKPRPTDKPKPTKKN